MSVGDGIACVMNSWKDKAAVQCHINDERLFQCHTNNSFSSKTDERWRRQRMFAILSWNLFLAYYDIDVVDFDHRSDSMKLFYHVMSASTSHPWLPKPETKIRCPNRDGHSGVLKLLIVLARIIMSKLHLWTFLICIYISAQSRH